MPWQSFSLFPSFFWDFGSLYQRRCGVPGDWCCGTRALLGRRCGVSRANCRGSSKLKKRHSAARPVASHQFGQVRGKRRGSPPVRIIAVVCVTRFEHYPKHAVQRESLTLSLDTTLPLSRPKTSIGTSKQLTAVSSASFAFQRTSNIASRDFAFVDFLNSGRAEQFRRCFPQ